MRDPCGPTSARTASGRIRVGSGFNAPIGMPGRRALRRPLAMHRKQGQTQVVDFPEHAVQRCLIADGTLQQRVAVVGRADRQALEPCLPESVERSGDRDVVGGWLSGVRVHHA